MRWIDFEHKKPTDSFPGWTAWTDDKWQEWLAESRDYLEEVTRLHSAGMMQERNAYIGENSAHWGKLKPWLLALSQGKCWFTEARDICSHMEVEHFRPKSVAKVLDGTEKDGYWWLAFDYSNYRIAGNVPNRKKGGWFPLHDDSRRSNHDARCEESEAPYLLDPISKSDTDLLAFDEEGNAIPAPGCDAWESERVKESIRRFKLNDHDALPEERRKVWQKTTQAIDGYLRAKTSYSPGINPTPKATMEARARELYAMTRSNAELSAVALWCIRFRNDLHLLTLVGG